MNLRRIDAFDINFVDSCAKKEFKLQTSTGIGEKRVYIGHDEARYDEFFDFENVEYFVTNKSDLLDYLHDAKEEFYSPTQEYKVDIKLMYENLVLETKNIPYNSIKYTFRKTYDKQHRYYLVLEPNCGDNSRMYDYIRNVVLPRVTKFCFIKFQDENTGKLYIYMRPIFFNSLSQQDNEEPNIGQELQSEEKETKIQRRKKQSKYRQDLFEQMPFCIFTQVTDDRILIACHIKPFSKCDSDEERYDYKNGITMTPTYHLLFDLGFISFQNDGTLLVSPFLSNINKKRLNLKEGHKYRLQSGSKKYLEYHRNNIYCNITNMQLD